MTLAKWFLRTGMVLVALGVALTAVLRIRYKPVAPGDQTFSIGKRTIQLPLGTGIIVLLLSTLYLNTLGRQR
ncbi:MAG TPA: DUF2905 domain-containing protein [Firmicutes bacterium]|nr:DUF2905 domain-containing protein [Bacillota bacterium]